MYLLYNIALWLALPFVVAYHLYRSLTRGRPAALMERFGFIPDSLRSDIEAIRKDHRPIWVHAVSVGETIAVKPLLKGLKERFPNRPLVVSNMTETGRAVSTGITDIDCCIRFPFDYGFAVRRLLKLVRPALVVVVETEIWPNFLREAQRLEIPTVIANGRISDRSFRRYLRARCFFRPVLDNVSAFCMQSAEDARRIESIGAAPKRVTVARNLKFDIPAMEVGASERSGILAHYRIPEGIAVFTAGSTHPGEEEQVISAFADLIRYGYKALLVLAPRHPERAGEVADILRKSELVFARRSQLSEESPELAAGQVLLLDTIGELMRLYAVSDLVFVGGSLVPVGGHNVLEPASLGAPVLFGPHMSNFREISDLILEYGAARQVADSAELGTELKSLLGDETAKRAMGANGRRLIAEQGGATGRHLAIIEKIVRSET